MVVVEPIADSRGDDELLVATADGDAEAFAVFYRRHVGEVLGFLSRRTGSYELAADLAGETFAGALLGCRRSARWRPGAGVAAGDRAQQTPGERQARRSRSTRPRAPRYAPVVAR